MAKSCAIQRTIALAAYAAFVLGPPAHSLAHASHGHRAGCCDEHVSGRVVSAACDESCKDPTHDHHHADHFHCCVVCQTHRGLSAAALTPAGTVSLSSTGARCLHVAQLPVVSSRFITPNIPRGPPPSSSR